MHIELGYSCSPADRLLIEFVRKEYFKCAHSVFQFGYGEDYTKIDSATKQYLSKIRYSNILNQHLFRAAVLDGARFYNRMKAMNKSSDFIGFRTTPLSSGEQWLHPFHASIFPFHLRSRGRGDCNGNPHFQISTQSDTCIFKLRQKRATLQLTASDAQRDVLNEVNRLIKNEKIPVSFTLKHTTIQLDWDDGRST